MYHTTAVESDSSNAAMQSTFSTENRSARLRGTSPRGVKSPQAPDSARRVGFAQPISTMHQPPAFTISLQDLQDPTEALQQSKLNRLHDDSSTLSSLISSVLGSKTSTPASTVSLKPVQPPRSPVSLSSASAVPIKNQQFPTFPRQTSAPSTLQTVAQQSASPDDSFLDDIDRDARTLKQQLCFTAAASLQSQPPPQQSMYARSSSFPRIASQNVDLFVGTSNDTVPTSSLLSSSSSSSRPATPSIALSSIPLSSRPASSDSVSPALFASASVCNNPSTISKPVVPPLTFSSSESRSSLTWSNSDEQSARSSTSNALNDSFNEDEELLALQRQYPTLAAKLVSSDGRQTSARSSSSLQSSARSQSHLSTFLPSHDQFYQPPDQFEQGYDEDTKYSDSASVPSSSYFRPTSIHSTENLRQKMPSRPLSSSGLASLAIVEPNQLFRQLLESSAIAAPPISPDAMTDITHELAAMIKARGRIALTEGIHSEASQVPMVPRDFARSKAPVACSQRAPDSSEAKIRRTAGQYARRQFAEMVERGLPLGGAPAAPKHRSTIVQKHQVPLQPSSKRHVSRTLKPVYF